MLERRVAGYFRGDHQAAIRYRGVGRQSISPQMRLAVVAAEDQKFPHHWGFDFDSIADAVEHQGAKGRLRGASTITQQVARNLFLWPGGATLRKGLEAYFTLLLELSWSKRRILEVYLTSPSSAMGHTGCPPPLRSSSASARRSCRYRKRLSSPRRPEPRPAPRREPLRLCARARRMDRGADDPPRRPLRSAEPLIHTSRALCEQESARSSWHRGVMAGKWKRGGCCRAPPSPRPR